MKALKLLMMAFAAVVTSCYFFPFVLTALPMANSKMILAAVGLVLLGINLTKKGNASVDNQFLNLSVWALAISFIAFFSITINHTPDYTFATYFMSMWVWVGGAYAVICLLKTIHGGISVPLVVNYLLVVCMLQCALAIVFDNIVSAQEWHERIFSGEAFMGNTEKDRLHGIGCSLDVAGFRFAAVMCMAAFILCRNFSAESRWRSAMYLLSICTITIIGNMIARSTIIGSIIAFGYIFLSSLCNNENKKLLLQLILFSVFAIVICAFLYNTDASFKQNIRFGFEGFFSLAEKGEWETNSNEILKNMVVWPDNLKTWLIGDGYFDNPTVQQTMSYDQYYIGPTFKGFYMNTDIGYLRYIFYFGVIGLIAFSGFLIYVSKVCIDRFKAFRWMFIMLLALNFIEWFKVSTDLFMVFAPFLCISAEENSEYLRCTEDS